MRTVKRSLSLILILLLVFTVMPFAEAKTGTLVKNSGTRHERCTALSAQAQAYYTGNYTYEAVSALSGSDSDPMNSAMFSRLSSLMRSTMTETVSYSSLTRYWPKTDANNGSTNPILFYSDELSGSYNREHVWPKSRASFYQSNGGSDLHHLRPTNENANSARSNYTFGNVKGVFSSYKTYAYEGKTVLWYVTDGEGRVEVNDNIKGDVARILLYVWCRWEEPNLYENDPNPVIGPGDDKNDGLKVIESRETLLQWMKQDPVDTWEMSRNDQCENVQGNRNVFIDYPEYAWLIFGMTPPADYVTPSGIAGSQSPTNPPAEPTTNPPAESPTATPTPTPTPTPSPTVPPAVELPMDGDYVVRMEGGLVSDHIEQINGNDCLKVELFVDGVTNERLLSSISLKLVYDPDQLTYVKNKTFSGNGVMNMLNPNTPGSVQHVFISTNGSNISRTEPLLTLWFTVADGLPARTRIDFGFSEPIKASSVISGDYTSQKRTTGALLNPFYIDAMYGDANCDGRVTAADAAAVLRALIGANTLSETGRVNANINGNGIDAESAAGILRYVVKLIRRFPIEQ